MKYFKCTEKCIEINIYFTHQALSNLNICHIYLNLCFSTYTMF